MRIVSLEVSGFRGLPQREVFDLDADAVLIAGANGQGKTSIFDAIFWAIAGSIPRLGDDQSVISRFSTSGEARVFLQLRDDRGSLLNLIRTDDGRTGQLTMESDSESFQGSRAESELLHRLWPEALSAAQPEEALCSALDRAVYLQQDLLTSFLSSGTDRDRYDAVSELVGTGRATELQTRLDQSRRAWSGVTNARSAEADEARDRLDRLRAQLDAMSEVLGGIGLDRAQWAAWWTRAHEFGVEGLDPPAVASASAAEDLDAAMRQLQSIFLTLDRRRQGGRGLLADWRALPEPPEEELESLRAANTASEAVLAEARQALATAEERAAELRRLQVELREERDQQLALAQLALRLLGDRCPVCNQIYDRDETVGRLNAILTRPADTPEPTEQTADVLALAQSARDQEREAIEASLRLRDGEASWRLWDERDRELRGRLREFNIRAPDPVEELSQAVAEFDAQLDAASALSDEGEQLALALARAGQLARREEVEREADSLSEELGRMRADIGARKETTELAAKMISALRDAGHDLVEDQLRRMGPLLQRIYATADPNPAFRVAALVASMRQGHGRLSPTISDPLISLEHESPRAVLSSSQMNVLAVSIFLSLNLGMAAVPLQTAMLDDPLQSLDDLNLLGVIDLLRRLRESRQIMIATHDARFANLLERKLRPVDAGQRTVLIELRGWGREGPEVVAREVDRDVAPLRIAGVA